MTTAEIFSELAAAGISVVASGDRLQVKGPETALTPTRLDLLREAKMALLFDLENFEYEPNPLAHHLAGWGGWVAVRKAFGEAIADEVNALAASWYTKGADRTAVTKEYARKMWELHDQAVRAAETQY